MLVAFTCMAQPVGTWTFSQGVKKNSLPLLKLCMCVCVYVCVCVCVCVWSL